MATSQRIDEFMEINSSTDNDILHPVTDNDTRWFSTYLMLKRAILLRNSLDLFVARHQTAKKDEKNLSKFTMSSHDWKYCIDTIAFIKPLYLLVKELGGKSGSRTHGYVSDVLPAHNIIREHMRNQLCAFTSNKYLQEDAEEERSRLQINTINADAKLLKYRLLLTSPVYYAAVVLIPWMKWEYFEEHLDSLWHNQRCKTFGRINMLSYQLIIYQLNWHP